MSTPATDFPKTFRVRQTFDAARVDDIAGEVQAQLARLELPQRIAPGQSVAITAGSRGVANIRVIVKAAVDHFKSIGAKPFVVPAMGSHGGGTAEGQRKVLASYGVTEDYCGCPIRAGMETVVVCQTAEGFPVHFDRHAFEADHVLVCNRVKPHTRFNGEIESGLMKMMLIGLGKHEGAKIYHRAIEDYSFDQIVRSVAGQVLAKCRIVAALGVVENGYDQTARVAAAPPDRILALDKELLAHAKRLMPRLPFDDVDVLVVDEIGKNISGTGMDTNILGRKFNDHSATGDERPRIKRIIVRSLTPETHGNATGIGLAEFATTRAVRQADLKISAINCITGSHPTGCMIPIHFDTDRELLTAALSTIGLTDPPHAKLLWIRNTLEIAELECSEAYLKSARANPTLQILSELRALPLGPDGNLPPYVVGILTTIQTEAK
jgi:hypothetical protein